MVLKAAAQDHQPSQRAFQRTEWDAVWEGIRELKEQRDSESAQVNNQSKGGSGGSFNLREHVVLRRPRLDPSSAYVREEAHMRDA